MKYDVTLTACWVDANSEEEAISKVTEQLRTVSTSCVGVEVEEVEE